MSCCLVVQNYDTEVRYIYCIIEPRKESILIRGDNIIGGTREAMMIRVSAVGHRRPHGGIGHHQEPSMLDAPTHFSGMHYPSYSIMCTYVLVLVCVLHCQTVSTKAYLFWRQKALS